jgi:hypothetical protein
MAGIIVKPRSRILHGHDWVYGSEILKTFGNPADGGIVSIRDGRDRLLGTGMYNARSQIVARRFSRQRRNWTSIFSSAGWRRPSSTGGVARSTCGPAGWSGAKAMGCRG